jgi:hypothetical protein
MTDIQDLPVAEPEPEVEHVHWIKLEDARAQAAAYVRGFLPAEPDEVDCETCRVIKIIANGLEGNGDGQV